MKLKSIIILMGIILMLMFVGTGCRNSEIEELRNRIEEIEKQLEQRESENILTEAVEEAAEEEPEEITEEITEEPAEEPIEEEAEEIAEEVSEEEIIESDDSDNDLNVQPTIESFSDSLGNSTTVSIAKENWDAEPPEEITVYIGDVITFEVITSDAENIEYKFHTPSAYEDQWNSSNKFTWNVKKEDFGKDKWIQVNIRNNDGLNWLSDCDDKAVLCDYTVLSK